LSDARAALDVDDEIMEAYYLESAAHARLGQYRPAIGALREAVRREPHDFLPWALLGDLATRRGDLERARGYYARAAALNPRDPAIGAMAEQ
jgi:Flp pilus assembly protein TadD